MSRPATTGNGGKGHWFRPNNRVKYEWNYIKTYGILCPKCGGVQGKCHYCNGKKIFDPKYYYQLGGS